MPYFKDAQNKPHFIESWAHIGLLPDGVVEIEQAEAEALAQAASVTPLPLREQAEIELAEIKDLMFDAMLLGTPVNPAMKAHFNDIRAIAKGIDSTSISLPKRPEIV